jgi:hypothetical protein
VNAPRESTLTRSLGHGFGSEIDAISAEEDNFGFAAVARAKRNVIFRGLRRENDQLGIPFAAMSAREVPCYRHIELFRGVERVAF